LRNGAASFSVPLTRAGDHFKMLPHLPTLSAADFNDIGDVAEVVLSIVAAGAAGWLAADRLHLIGWLRATAAGVGATSVYVTFLPSMMLFGSLGGGLFYVPLALLISAIHAPEQVVAGQVIVAISTAIGCSLVAWLACTGVFMLPALASAAARRGRS
jgi:predicted RecA/RadA family phage recombinase